MTSKSCPRLAEPALVHAAEIHLRLHKIEGQVNGITTMYEEGRPCAEILDQVAVARRALEAIGLLILDDHVNRCLEPVIHDSPPEEKVMLLMTAVRRFVRSA